MANNYKKLTETHKKITVKIQKHLYFSGIVFTRNRSGGRRAKRVGSPDAWTSSARRSSRVQHKSTNTAEVRDSEQKAPDMQHKSPNKKVLAPSWLANFF